MRLTDWQGNEYGPGDTIIYPVMSGRTVSMQQATVLDIWTVYNCPEDYKWKRLKEDEPIPTKEEWEWGRSGEQSVRISKGHKPVKTEMRVKLQPEGKTSRGWSARQDDIGIWLDPEGNDIEYDAMQKRILEEHGYNMHDWNLLWDKRKHPRDFGYSIRREAVTPKPVTLLICDNITLLRNSPENIKQMELEDSERSLYKKVREEMERRAKETPCELPTGSGEYCCRRIEHDGECSHKIAMKGT